METQVSVREYQHWTHTPLEYCVLIGQLLRSSCEPRPPGGSVNKRVLVLYARWKWPEASMYSFGNDAWTSCSSCYRHFFITFMNFGLKTPMVSRVSVVQSCSFSKSVHWRLNLIRIWENNRESTTSKSADQPLDSAHDKNLVWIQRSGLRRDLLSSRVQMKTLGLSLRVICTHNSLPAAPGTKDTSAGNEETDLPVQDTVLIIVTDLMDYNHSYTQEWHTHTHTPAVCAHTAEWVWGPSVLSGRVRGNTSCTLWTSCERRSLFFTVSFRWELTSCEFL